MSRRSLQYRDALRRYAKQELASIISMKHRFAKSNGRKQLYDAARDRFIPGIAGKCQASMPIKSDKAMRLAAIVGRHFA